MTNPPEQPLSQMVQNAYARLSGVPPNPVSAAYAGIPSTGPLERFDQLQAARGNTADAFAAVQPRSLVPLFNPLTTPCRGMFSGLTPSALHPGQFSVIQNLRFDDGSLMCRQPTTNRGATGLPGGASSARGLWSGFLNGVFTLVGAWFDGSKVGIYSSTNGTSFTAATQSSGAAYWGDTTEAGYAVGDNRLPDTGRPVSFAVATNAADGLDYLVIQNGTCAPRVFGQSALNGSNVRVVKQYSPPAWATNQQIYGQLHTLWPLNQAYTGAPTITASDPTNFNLGFVFSFGEYAQLTTTSSISTTVPPTIVLNFSALGSAVPTFTANPTQVIFISDNMANSIWANLKIEFSNDPTFATGTIVVNDPTASSPNVPYETAWTSSQFGNTAASGGVDGEELVVYEVAQLGIPASATYNYMRLTYNGTVPTSNRTTNIHAIAQGGDYLAFTEQFALTYAGMNGLSESAVVIAPPTTACTQTILGLGGVKSVIPSIPYVAGVCYDYTIPAQGPTSADLNNGCDSIYLYRQDSSVDPSTGQLTNASGGYFYTATIPVGTYSSGWKWRVIGSSSTSASRQSGLVSYQDTTGFLANVNYSLDISRYSPDSYATCMPDGVSLASANQRFFVGQQGGLYISEETQPFRYRPLLQFVNGQPVPRSAAYISLSGQTVQAFATPSGSALASSTIFFWTQTKTYALGGFDGYSLSQPNEVAEVGCSAPGSVAQYKDAIFWLDDNQQIRRFSYGRAFLYGYSNAYAYDLMPAISKRVVDDRTRGIPASRLPWASGAASFDRYYLCYTPSGGTDNSRVLVFDETVGGFVEDTLSAGAESMVYALFSGTNRELLFQGSDGSFYTHEDPASLTSLVVNLDTQELHQQMWSNQFFGRVGLVADVQSGQTATITKAIKPSLSDPSTIDLSTGETGQVWRWDSRAGSTQPGLAGLSCQVQLSMTMTPGTRIYALLLETAPELPAASQL